MGANPDQSTMIVEMYQEEKDCSIMSSGDAGVILLLFLGHQTSNYRFT